MSIQAKHLVALLAVTVVAGVLPAWAEGTFRPSPQIPGLHHARPQPITEIQPAPAQPDEPEPTKPAAEPQAEETPAKPILPEASAPANEPEATAPTEPASMPAEAAVQPAPEPPPAEVTPPAAEPAPSLPEDEHVIPQCPVMPPPDAAVIPRLPSEEVLPPPETAESPVEWTPPAEPAAAPPSSAEPPHIPSEMAPPPVEPVTTATPAQEPGDWKPFLPAEPAAVATPTEPATVTAPATQEPVTATPPAESSGKTKRAGVKKTATRKERKKKEKPVVKLPDAPAPAVAPAQTVSAPAAESRSSGIVTKDPTPAEPPQPALSQEQQAMMAQALHHYKRGNAYGHRDMFTQAVDEYRKALMLIPSLTDAHVGLSSAYAKLNEWEEVFAEAGYALDKKAVFVDPSNQVRAYYNLATAYCVADNYRQAKKYFKRVQQAGHPNADRLWQYMQRTCKP